MATKQQPNPKHNGQKGNRCSAWWLATRGKPCTEHQGAHLCNTRVDHTSPTHTCTCGATTRYPDGF